MVWYEIGKRIGRKVECHFKEILHQKKEKKEEFYL